jgi:hypothetical protein
MHLVNTYSLDNNGLKISYTKDNQKHRLTLPPVAASKLLKDLKAVRAGQEWGMVVKLFAIDTHLPGAIAQHCSRHRRTYEYYSGTN